MKMNIERKVTADCVNQLEAANDKYKSVYTNYSFSLLDSIYLLNLKMWHCIGTGFIVQWRAL